MITKITSVFFVLKKDTARNVAPRRNSIERKSVFGVTEMGTMKKSAAGNFSRNKLDVRLIRFKKS